MDQEKSRGLCVALPSGEKVAVSHAQAEVLDALRACMRRGMPDATRREVIEVMQAQLNREVIREHVYSGRFSELVKLQVIEESPEARDDRFTVAIRAQLGRASRVKAYRIAEPVQRCLPLQLVFPRLAPHVAPASASSVAVV